MPRRARHYWLFKSEPDEFSIEDLRQAPRSTELWDGVRNYQARNMLRDDIRPGDGVVFYHSNAKPPGVAGFAEVVKEGYPDPTQFDSKHKYYDSKSNPDDPRWYVVDIRHVETLPGLISLNELREHEALAEMMVIRRGMRLSVQPVTKKEWDYLHKLAKKLPRD